MEQTLHLPQKSRGAPRAAGLLSGLSAFVAALAHRIALPLTVAPVAGHAIYLTSPKRPNVARVAQLRSKNLQVAVTSDLTVIDRAAREFSFSRLICIIQADDFGDLDDLIEHLITLRQCNPAVEVILVSRKVNRHDFSAERLAICDVTLQYPYTSSDLDEALISAHHNNLAWRKRTRLLQ
ncbi:MAG: hypothetical protein GC186_06560 [Rhodobacteraceae bacterium]|nr:hypothetical protein [Paracoccaceae bacterium]